MRRIVSAYLLWGMIFLMLFSAAEEALADGSVSVDQEGAATFDLPFVNGTDSSPDVPAEAAFALTMEDSVLPFAEIDWGAAMDDVLAVTAGQIAANETEVEQEVVLPGIRDALTAVYHFGDTGLESVSVVLETKKKTGSMSGNPDADALVRIADRFFNTQDADEMMRYNADSFYCYKSLISDVLVGYIPNGKEYRFGFFSISRPRSTRVFSGMILCIP